MELSYKHLNANKPNDQKEMDRFLKRHSQAGSRRKRQFKLTYIK